MMLEVYSVYDKAVGAYLQPFYCRARGEALRSFSEACNKEDNQFHRHASDYYLVYCGSWDDGAGVFVTNDPVRVISAVECIIPVPFDAADGPVVSGPPPSSVDWNGRSGIRR